MSALAASWIPLQHLPDLPRSSQTLSVLHASLHLFSGEYKPRVPVTAELQILPLNPSIPIAVSILPNPSGPPRRVGAAAANTTDKLYVFGGRGGTDMKALEEAGRVWCFTVGDQKWEPLDPADENAPFPEARSYHTAAAAGGKVYVHAGCATEGRLGDLWAFEVESRTWVRCADAPGDPRGGTAIAATGGREIWRFGGFNGKVEIGAVIDVYDIPSDTWRSIPYSKGPAARSVSCLVPITHPETGKEYLITIFGEYTPSNDGHAGAGEFLEDVWGYDIATAEWSKVEVNDFPKPEPRGWFAVGEVRGTHWLGDGVGIIVQGGLSAGNTRLGDWWVLMFE